MAARSKAAGQVGILAATWLLPSSGVVLKRVLLSST
jgi:hypothetical protein